MDADCLVWGGETCFSDGGFAKQDKLDAAARLGSVWGGGVGHGGCGCGGRGRSIGPEASAYAVAGQFGWDGVAIENLGKALNTDVEERWW